VELFLGRGGRLGETCTCRYLPDHQRPPIFSPLSTRTRNHKRKHQTNHVPLHHHPYSPTPHISSRYDYDNDNEPPPSNSNLVSSISLSLSKSNPTPTNPRLKKPPFDTTNPMPHAPCSKPPHLLTFSPSHLLTFSPCYLSSNKEQPCAARLPPFVPFVPFVSFCKISSPTSNKGSLRSESDRSKFEVQRSKLDVRISDLILHPSYFIPFLPSLGLRVLSAAGVSPIPYPPKPPSTFLPTFILSYFPAFIPPGKARLAAHQIRIRLRQRQRQRICHGRFLLF